MKRYIFSDILVTTIVHETSYSFDIRDESGLIVESFAAIVYPENGYFFIVTKYKSCKEGIINGFIDSLSAHKKAMIILSLERNSLSQLYKPNQYED